MCRSGGGVVPCQCLVTPLTGVGLCTPVGAEEEEEDEYSASVSQILERHGSRRGSRRLQRQASSRDSRRSLRRRRSRGSKSHSIVSGE